MYTYVLLIGLYLTFYLAKHSVIHRQIPTCLTLYYRVNQEGICRLIHVIVYFCIIYVHTYVVVHIRTYIYVYMYIFYYSTHLHMSTFEQIMDLKHKNILELHGISQSSMTYVVMPYVGRKSIQVSLRVHL